MKLTLSTATPADALALAALHNAVSVDLTLRHCRGPWTSVSTEKGILFAMRHALVVIARKRHTIIGTLRLPAKNPGPSTSPTSRP
jgi:hypothetical protein